MAAQFHVFLALTLFAAGCGGNTNEARALDLQPTDEGNPSEDGEEAEAEPPPVEEGTPDTEPEPEASEPTGDLPCEVEQILVDRCGGCHGESPRFGAPMSLVTLDDLHAPSTADPTRPVYAMVGDRMVDDRSPMPPLSAPPLSDSEFAFLDAWISFDAPAGEACAEPPPGQEDPEPPPLPSCDHEIELRAHGANEPGDSSPYEVPKQRDHYECFYFDVPWDTPMHGLSFEPLIDDDRVVHHWLLYADDGATADGTHSGCGGTHGDANLLAGWAPGGEPFILPADVGLELPTRGEGHFILEVHYYNPGRLDDARDRSGVKLCATSQLQPNNAGIHWLGSELIVLVGGGEHTVRGTCRPDLSEPVHLVSIWPHMHERGSHMKLIVHRANGSQEVILDTPFDFNYQVTYASDAVIHPGDWLETLCTFDNPGGVAHFGPGTENEMCYNFTVAYPSGALTNGGSITGVDNACMN